MSLDKAIRSGKEHRQPYRKSKAFDSTCRNHGSCPWCQNNRHYHDKKAELSALEQEQELERELLEHDE